MLLNTKKIITITDANQNFSKVARIVDQEKSVLVMKNKTHFFDFLRLNLF